MTPKPVGVHTTVRNSQCVQKLWISFLPGIIGRKRVFLRTNKSVVFIELPEHVVIIARHGHYGKT